MTDQIKVQSRSTSERETQSVVRVLRWYEKNGDALIGETLLNSLNLSELQKLFRESSENPMVDSYPISMAQVKQLQQTVSEPIDLSAYDYYLECDAM